MSLKRRVERLEAHSSNGKEEEVTFAEWVERSQNPRCAPAASTIPTSVGALRSPDGHVC